MKRVLILLLTAVLLCFSAAALAAGDVRELEIRTEKLPLYTSDDPLLASLLKEGEESLPVLLLQMKKSLTLQVNALPKDADNRRIVL